MATSHTRTCLRSWLSAIWAPKTQMLFLLWASDIHFAMQQIYKKRYAPTERDYSLDDVGKDSISNHRRLGKSLNEERDLRWRDFPKLWTSLIWFREFETIYFVYNLVKNSLSTQLEALIRSIFSPSLPPSCYLPGRMIVDKELDRFVSITYSCYHLTWRYLQWRRHNQLEMSLVYFFLLDEGDIQSYYEALLTQTNTQIRSTNRVSLRVRAKTLNPERTLPSTTFDYRFRMMHEVMSYRLDHVTGVTYELRPNRTPEVRKRLRFIMGLLLCILALFMFATFILSCYGLATIMIRAYRIIEDYPGCNPELERMVETGEMSPMSYYMGEHTLVTFPNDLVMLILWGDGWLSCATMPVLMHLLQEDLLIYLRHLNAKIKYVLEVARYTHARHETFAEACLFDKQRKCHALWLDERVFDLLMQMQDMILQIKQADQLITDCMTGFLYHWFSLHGYFIYRRINDQPSMLIFTMSRLLTLVAIGMSMQCILLLRVHHSALKLYPKFCSLMAYDNSPYKLRFNAIIDHFVLGDTCFTLLRNKRMTAAFYLTLVGWACSWHCILSKIMYETN